ncbi:Six-hairpin glycosidase [Cordyceps fumosorosea ARSEF 2679]|uniref:Six-hairpin glycosidase n=1 Tax=Cordyceps fumosorosea (strain ARSEF 2679) TaxID=1081104 RepID=A0A168DAD3_CORFA|nr:Six-hairpin glycosidase [Cordyceps fumosorosea ARSEF 2679]OAA72356.1 Six-hairpin glycosidase [Cordyceps fumosorosea ARSEF 2679]
MSPSTLPTSDQNMVSVQHAMNGTKSHLKVQAGLQGAANGTGVTQGADSGVSKLFSDTVILKIWKTAVDHLTREDPPQSFPETCPQTGPQTGQYQYRDAEFWTCGFFPGSLYCLLERSARYPQAFLTEKPDGAEARERLRSELLGVCRRWSEPLHDMSNRKDTHDIGFIVEPALRRDFELTGDARSLASVVNAAESLASRYSERTRAIRSWDRFVNNGNNLVDKDSEFIVIIDSMCNLDLLYYAGHHASSQRLIDIATTHALTIRETHLRPEPSDPGCRHPLFSTCHVANLSPKDGRVLRRLTAQGYADSSTWSRGQAWAILGFAQTHAWTGNPIFLQTACGLADYFLLRLRSAPDCVEPTRHVPLWDFDAPVEDEQRPLRDASAGMIAANGMLLMANALAAAGDGELFEKYYRAAMAIARDTIELCYARDEMRLVRREEGNTGSVSMVARRASDCEDPFDCILKHSTANYNGNWTDRLLQFGYA